MNCTLIFSCNFLASKSSPSVKISNEAIDAIASWPMYSSKSSLPKSIAKIAAGSMIASLKTIQIIEVWLTCEYTEEHSSKLYVHTGTKYQLY